MPDFRPGDVLKAETIQELWRRSEPPDIRGSGGVSVRSGRAINIAGIRRGAFLAKVTGSGITALSGTTPGTGTVDVLIESDATGTETIVDSGQVATVFNFTGQAYLAGTYCWVAEDEAGTLWVVTGTTVPGHFWCQLSGSLGPATGTWPSITATSTTANVYVGSSTSLTLYASSATIYNRRNVTWAASKTTLLLPNADGSYDIDDQDC